MLLDAVAASQTNQCLYCTAGSNHAVLIAVGNILVAILFRNEIFLFGLYWCTINGCLFLHMPLKVRNWATDLLLHIGGLHSGCGISSLMWLGLTIAHLIQHLDMKVTTPLVVSMAWVVMALLIVTNFAAFPHLALLAGHHWLYYGPSSSWRMLTIPYRGSIKLIRWLKNQSFGWYQSSPY